jgi:subfamily B ATP-binding cassette protein MsbA
MLRYAGPYKWRMAFGVFAVVFVALSNLLLPQFLGFVWGRLLPGHSLSSPVTLSLPGRIMTYTCGHWLLLVFLAIVALYIVRGFISFARTYVMSWVGQRLLFDLRNAVFQRLQELPIRFYQLRGPGNIMARITGDVDVMGGMITGSSIDLFTNIVMVVAIVVWLLNKHWKLALISFIVVPLFAANYQMFIRSIQRVWRSLRDKWSDLYGEIWESIAGAQVVKAFSQERYETRMFFRGMRETYGYSVRLAKVGTAMGGIAEFLSVSGTALILLYGGWEVLRGNLSLQDLIVFNAYLGFLYGPVVTLSSTSEIIQRALISADRVFDILDAGSTVQEAPDAIPLPPIGGRVTFENVSFAYEPEKRVLTDINLDIAPGTVVALVGPSGSGKTTLANLVPRFYDPTAGRVLIDGRDLRGVTLRSLRSQIGIVLQYSFLFTGTIKDNLRYGRMDATDAEIVDAAITANAHEFIVKELPEGYDTEVGAGGQGLSGGQSQRIAIARALLRNPRILILDEATSSLDSRVEAQIQEAMERLMRQRTTFIIAHRLSTIMAADIIIVMDEGKIVQRGTHEELVAQEGLYAELYRKQFRIQQPADSRA